MTVSHTDRVGRLLELDFHLLPLRPDSKAPLEAGWPDAPPMSAEAASDWVARGGGLGVNLGPSRLIVLDAEDAAATEYLVDLGFTPTVATANSQDTESGKYGGRHVYLRVPEHVHHELHTAPGFPVGDGGTLEVLAGRRFAVLPPTTLNIRTYSPVAGGTLDPNGSAEIHDAPYWLFDASVPAPAGAGPMVGKLAERPVRPRNTDSTEFNAIVDSLPWDIVIDDDTRLSNSGTDSCGCPMLRWAGASSPRSVVLHGCTTVGAAAAVWSSTMQAELGLDLEGDHCSRLQLAAALRGLSIREAMDELAERIGVEWPSRWTELDPMILPDGVVPAGALLLDSAPDPTPLAAVVGGVHVPSAVPKPLASVTSLPVVLPSPAPVPNRPRVWSATDLDESRALEWVADGRVVAGALNYLVGPEGIGKSLFVVWLTALLTTGRGSAAFGIAGGAPQTVALVLTEDDWSTIARPRLEVAGADLNRVRVICADPDGSGAPTFPEDMDVAMEAADGAAVIIVDAWADTLPARLSVRDPQQARQALHPWKELAGRTSCAVLLSGHLNREKGGNVRAAYGMTGELRKKVRSSLLALRDPESDDCLVIGPEKSNVGPPLPGSRFRISPVPYGGATVPRLELEGDGEMPMTELFGVVAAAETDSADSMERSEVDTWLAEYLREYGAAPRKSVLAAGRAEGFSDATIKRSAARIHVISVASGAAKNAKCWKLP